MEIASTRRLDKGVWALGWVSFLSDVASDMIYPLLPDFLTRTLHAGPAALGLIEGVAEATASIMKAVSGWWSDRFQRRKPLVVAGYAIAAAARPLVGFAGTWTEVLAIRFADRVGKGIRTSPRDALLADLVPPGERGRAYGLQRAMDNAGAVAGPLLAAALLKWVFSDERSVFLLAAVPGAIAIAVLVLRVRETPRRAEEKPAAAAPAARGPLPARLWTLLGVFVLFALASSTDAFLLLKARDSGVPLWQLPLLWAAFNGIKAAAGVPGGALADRLGHVRTILAGWAVYAASYAAFAFATTAREVWSVFALYALFYALTEGAERALVADLVRSDARGRAFGAFHASVGLASLPASILFGVWWNVFGPRVAFLIGAGIAALAAVLLAVWSLTRGNA
ncbi:MAG TPA: MFS transporter [Thermoanaerobaculia bacterium]|nr:MFS transporter [Thermoanaerobaculia bacterium]